MNKEQETLNVDKTLFEYLTNKSMRVMRGVQIIKLDYEDYDKVSYINLTMRMGIDRETGKQLQLAGFHLSRSWLNRDNYIIYQFMRWKEPYGYNVLAE